MAKAPNGDAATPLDPLGYYQLKTIVLELALFDARATAQRATLVAALQAQLRALGLDPACEYRLEEAGHRVTPVAPLPITDSADPSGRY